MSVQVRELQSQMKELRLGFSLANTESFFETFGSQAIEEWLTERRDAAENKMSHDEALRLVAEQRAEKQAQKKAERDERDLAADRESALKRKAKLEKSLARMEGKNKSPKQLRQVDGWEQKLLIVEMQLEGMVGQRYDLRSN